MIAALLLAAGRGSRFGGGKLLAPLRGRPVLRWSAEAVSGAVDGTWVVVPAGDDALAAALHGLAVHVVPHARRDEGLGSSIALGVAQLPAPVAALLVALGDQPFVAPAVIARLVARWRATGAPAVVPRYRDGVGHPVLFDRACFPALAALTGDRGARGVLDALGDAVAVVEVDAEMPRDVDTRDALAALEHERDAGDKVKG